MTKANTKQGRFFVEASTIANNLGEFNFNFDPIIPNKQEYISTDLLITVEYIGWPIQVTLTVEYQGKKMFEGKIESDDNGYYVEVSEDCVDEKLQRQMNFLHNKAEELNLF